MNKEEKCEWRCQKCGAEIVVGEFKYNIKQCVCGYWMQWRILAGIEA